MWRISTFYPAQNKQCLLSKPDSLFMFRVRKIRQHPQLFCVHSQPPMSPHPPRPFTPSMSPHLPCSLTLLCPLSCSMSIHNPVFLTPPCLLTSSASPPILTSPHIVSVPSHSMSSHTPTSPHTRVPSAPPRSLTLSIVPSHPPCSLTPLYPVLPTSPHTALTPCYPLSPMSTHSPVL